MYKLIETAKPEKVRMFDTEEEALAFVKRQKKARNFYTLTKEQEDVEVSQKDAHHSDVKTEDKVSKRNSWTIFKNTIDFSDAIEVTRENVKKFYRKEGFIQVVDPRTGKTLHIGRTTNMGKVFSNYINCARYNQSYDFDLAHGHKLYFKEQKINY